MNAYIEGLPESIISANNINERVRISRSGTTRICERGVNIEISRLNPTMSKGSTCTGCEP